MGGTEVILIGGFLVALFVFAFLMSWSQSKAKVKNGELVKANQIYFDALVEIRAVDTIGQAKEIAKQAMEQAKTV